jgi:hypothetical protein
LNSIESINNLSNIQSSSTNSNSQTEYSTLNQPLVKRSRQLKFYGTTKNNELTVAENNEINKCVIKMITTDYQPLSIVENVGFLEYSKQLQPLYTPPSRKLLTTKLLPDQYNVIYLKLKYHICWKT